jgi:hypothetical protein
MKVDWGSTEGDWAAESERNLRGKPRSGSGVRPTRREPSFSLNLLECAFARACARA